MYKLVALAVFLTAAPVLATPLPGEESGRIDDRAEDRDSVGLRVARGALFVPRILAKIAFAPFEGAIWALDRYQLRERMHRLFWNDANTIGLSPTLQVDAGFGANAGGHFVGRSREREGPQIDLRASFGGRFQRNASVSVYSGRHFDRLRLESHVQHQRRPREPFFGIGNFDDPPIEPEMPVDPRAAGGPSQFRHELMRGIAVADLRLARPLHVRASSAIADHSFAGTGAANTVESKYVATNLVGFDGYFTLYYELELRLDTRRAYNTYEPASVPTTGGLAAAFVGRMEPVHGEGFWRYGGDLQRFFRLADGPRVLGFRLHFEGVSGGLDDVPFFELARLGGKDHLRGYVADRFRDRLAVVGSAEYRWDLARQYSASLFVDAGRVYEAVEDLGFRDLRVGYGVALEIASETSFLARFSVASSIDGGLQLNLAFDPVFDLDGRVQR